MKHHSVARTCQESQHDQCSGWVTSWDTPGLLACACGCHTGEQQTRQPQPLAARTFVGATSLAFS